jgi:long-chain acyl-CoA synthetase
MSQLKSLINGVMTLEPSSPAIEFHGRWHSWLELTQLGTALESLFVEHGVAAGTRIGGILRNTPEIAAVILSVITGDRCIVTLNPIMPDDKLAADIVNLQVPVIIALAQDWARAEVAAAAKASGALCIEVGDNLDAPLRVLHEGQSGDFRVEADGVGIEMLTSGTTGTPKRIPLPSKNFERMILDASVFESRAATDEPKLRNGVSIHNTPFSHIGGIFSLFTTISAGRKLCMLDRFTVDGFVDAVERHRVKAVGAPPSALRMILDAKVPKEKLESLIVFRTSTAPLDPDLADAFFERYNIPVLQNYGATEFAGGVAGWTLDDFRKSGHERRGSVGKMNPGVEGRIVDAETGEPVEYGEPGLLELKADHLGNGQSWLRTTDIARMDDEQFLWILGRADNAIIRGGFKIIPDDVVRAIEGHPAVLEACVMPLPDARLGQIPVAAYTLKTGELLEPDALKEFLRTRLTPYQVPVQILLLAEMPRTPSMKVSQPELKKIFLAH